MKAVTVFIEFEDGTQAAFIGPLTDALEHQLGHEDFEVKAIGFSEPGEFPDCKLSEIEEMVYESGVHH